MRLRLLCVVILALVSMVALRISFDAAVAEASLSSDGSEEFVGPFASWRQVTCGGVDDTTMLQHELDVLGTPGHSPVLYVQPGTCVIKSTLRLSHKQYIAFLGADPGLVTIRWAGGNKGQMMRVNGVAYSRFGRITWDGAGSAGAIYRLQWDGSSNYFPTGNVHEDEVFEHAAFGIRAGAEGQGGEAETSIIRSYFHDLVYAGINLEDFNSLDWWIWSSRFERLRDAVTNNYFGAAGNFHVYDSVFLNNSDGDLTFTNTGVFSARRNWSSGSAHFLEAGPIGSAAALVTLQDNVVNRTSGRAVFMQDPGPLVLIDNVFATGGVAPVWIQEAYTSAATADVVGIHNTYQAARPYQDVRGRARSVDDITSATVALASQPPPMLPTPTNQGRPVFEPRSGNIQAAIDAAVASGSPRAIVHLPYGVYAVNRTLVIPPNADLQLVGDGRDVTVLRSAGATPVLLVHGPSRAVIEDLQVDGNNAADGIVFDTADQPAGRVHAEELNVTYSQTGVAASAMRQSSIDLESFNAAGNTGAIELSAGSQLRIFGASTSNNRTMYSVEDGSALTATDVWGEGATTQHVAANGSGVLTLDGGRLAAGNGSTLDLTTFSGSSTVINQLATNVVKSGSDSLVLGLVAPQGVWSAGPPRWALWADRLFQGGGSQQKAEAASGVYDASSFLRQHLAPLRAARPAASPGLVPGVTDVQLYRLDVTHSQNGVTFSGTGGMVGR